MQLNYNIEVRRDHYYSALYVAHIVMQATKNAPKYTGNVLYYLILRKCFQDTIVVPSSTEIAEADGFISSRSVRRCLQWLEANGWIATILETRLLVIRKLSEYGA
jgi:hypothetical protein